VVWLGCGLYELFLVREIRRARSSAEEIPLLRIYGRYAGIVAIATLATAGAGVFMSIMLGWGFFTVLWLGIKQGIMAAIILAMLVLAPLFLKTYARDQCGLQFRSTEPPSCAKFSLACRAICRAYAPRRSGFRASSSLAAINMIRRWRRLTIG
jgi:hypothetical protein